jgi:hypothetical protein
LVQHIHSEAFCLIVYCSADGKLKEEIWNGRDGGVPSMIHGRDGAMILRREDSKVQYLGPNYQPASGDRMFVALGFDQLLARKLRLIKSEWSNPEFQRIVVASLVLRLGARPSPLMIAN